MRTLGGLCREYSELYLRVQSGVSNDSDRGALCSVADEIDRIEKDMGVAFKIDLSDRVKCMFVDKERVICEYSTPYDKDMESMVNKLFTNQYSEGYTSYDTIIESIPKCRVSSLFDLSASLEGGEVVVRDMSDKEIDYKEYEEVVSKNSLIRLFFGNRDGKIIMKFARVVNRKVCFLYSLKFI